MAFSTVRRKQAVAVKSGDSARATHVYFQEVSKLLDYLNCKTQSEAQQCVDGLNSSQRSFIRGISLGGAIWAVRESSREWIELGLRALPYEDLSNDYRDTIIKLVLLRHSAQKLGCDFQQLAKQVYSNWPWELPEWITGYVEDPVQELSSVGYVESTDEKGEFTYKRTW